MNGLEMEEQSDRPRTPVSTLWFEFLLEPSLLDKHFASENPDPPISQLLVQFVDQSIKSQGVEETQAHVRKTHSLKLLALQVAANFNWNLKILKQSLPLYMVHKVLKDFVETVSPTDLNIQPGNDVCALEDYVLIALTIYNRWCIQTIVDSGFPTRLTKPTVGLLPNGANLNVAGVHEMVIKTVRDTLHDSVSFLERCLPLNRNISLPTTRSFVHPTTDECLPKDMIDFTKGVQIQKEEYLCQLCFDLGGYYFHQRELGKAGAMFERVVALLPMLSGDLIYKDIDTSALDGYLAACGRPSITKPSGLAMVQQVEQCASQGYQGIVDLLVEDNAIQTLPALYREALQHVLKGSEHGAVGRQVAMCNLVRRHLTNTSGNCEQLGLLKGGSVEDVKLLAEIIAQTALRCSASNKNKLKLLVRFLCDDKKTCSTILQGAVRKLFTDEELKVLECKPSLQATVSVSTESTVSHQGNVALQLGQIEQRLIQSNCADEIDQLLTTLRKIAPAWNCNSICKKWQIDKSYAFILDGVGNKKTKDFVFMLLVKAQHCAQIKNYESAKSLLETAHNTTKDFSFKLSKALQHEILYIELLRASDRQRISGSHVAIANVTQRIHACLSSAKSDRDIPPRAQIVEKCILHLLNSKDWMAVLNVDSKESYVQLCQLIAKACKDLPDLNESRRPARELWDTLTQIFSAGAAQVKRNISGRPVANIHRDSAKGLSPRSVFLRLVDQIQEPLCLSILLSCIVRLHNLLKDDAAVELSHDYVVLWPSTITNVSSVSIDAVTMTTSHMLRHVLSVDPCQPSWLKTQADSHYANNQYAAALQYYLQAALVVTKFFEVPVPKEIWNEQVYKRMIKCCTNLKCYTQVAILCQFLEPVDYATAFKSLQEKTCYDAMDALYDCIWDVAILEFLVFNHNKLNELDKKQKAIQAMNTPELNTSNPDEILQVAIQKRNRQFLRAMCKQYL
ncbi:integrator complex subunit 8-like isoform X1 [Amphiura filiformis]|uniref:integrator complex subunit 8-like isoform X1 n=1 Tax=Amphiura filiformis TaxID=82378 RepID=UPI003B21A24E